MQARAPLPANERERLATLESLQILDTEPEPAFDRITRLAARLFDVPIALVSLVDEGRQWFESCVGLATKATIACAQIATSRDRGRADRGAERRGPAQGGRRRALRGEAGGA